jgi:hypothetical protein
MHQMPVKSPTWDVKSMVRFLQQEEIIFLRTVKKGIDSAMGGTCILFATKQKLTALFIMNLGKYFHYHLWV